MSITIKEVVSRCEKETFIHFPAELHQGHAGWLPPLYSDEKRYFDPQKNPAFRSCDYRMVLACRDGKTVGRIMGIISHPHNNLKNLRNVRFCFMECGNDQEVAHALIADIEEWGKRNGMNKIVGPFGFSDRDVQGLLIEGFEHEPVVDSACNFEFLPKLVEREGYIKEIDCVMHRRPFSTPIPETFEKLYQRVISKKAFEFLEFTSRGQFKPYIVPALRLVNESFSNIYGFIPMDDVEIADLAGRYLPLLDARFVKGVTKNGELVAFLVCMPNPYRGIQKARGRLFPFGIFHILHAMRHAESINTMLGAIRPDCQKQGLDIFLGYTTFMAAIKAGMKSIDSHVVMEDNADMTGIFSRYDGVLLKRFRIYQKRLTT